MSSNSSKNTTMLDACTDPTSPPFVAQATFLFAILIVTIIGNFVVFMTVIMTNSLRCFTNYLVASLAVSDLLVGSLSLPFRIHQTLHNTKWCLGVDACRFWICMDLFCCCASVGNLALISLDRFLATKYPLTYHGMLSWKTQTIMLLTVWMYSAVVASAGLGSWTYPNKPVFVTTNGCFKNDPYFYTFAAFAGFFLPLTIILVAYSYVFKISVMHWRAIRRLTIPAIENVSARSPSRRSALTREIKAAKTLGIVVGAFVACWAPFFIILIARFWCDVCFQNHTSNGPMMFVSITFVYTLPNINSTLNPFIYVIFSKTLRQAFIRLFNNVINKLCGANDGLSTRRRHSKSISAQGRTNAVVADEANDAAQ